MRWLTRLRFTRYHGSVPLGNLVNLTSSETILLCDLRQLAAYILLSWILIIHVERTHSNKLCKGIFSAYKSNGPRKTSSEKGHS